MENKCGGRDEMRGRGLFLSSLSRVEASKKKLET